MVSIPAGTPGPPAAPAYLLRRGRYNLRSLFFETYRMVYAPTALSFPKSRINVLLMEGIHRDAVEAFKKQGFRVEEVYKLTHEELMVKIRDVHIIGVRSKTKLTADMLKAGHKLLAVGCFCIGTDQTDLEAAAELGIAVFNAPFANTRSVAELVLSHVIALARHVQEDCANMHQGVWKKSATGKNEVRGKTLGIVGYGHVGSQLSILAESMGVHVQFYDIIPILPLGNAESVSTLDQLLQTSDFVSLHVPFTEATHNMVGEREINLMKEGAYLINYARGKVVDIRAASMALHSGKLAGAAFDVFPVEPASGEPFSSELMGCPNTILTPHIGGSTEEAQALIGNEVAHKLMQFVNRGTTVTSVNFPEIDLRDNALAHTLLNIHHNVPGVMRDINNVLGQYNIMAQVLATQGPIGYLMCHVDREMSKEIKAEIEALPSSIRTRILF